MYDIIIIGAGTAGMTAALYGLRAGKRVLLIESENFGGQITYSPRVENYPGIPQISGNEFASNLLDQVLSHGGDTELSVVTEIRQGESLKGRSQGVESRTGEPGKTVVTEEDAYECRSVILATGVKHRQLGLPRETDLVGEGVSYCAVCDGAFYKEKATAVIGGGNTALQDAGYLSSYCSKVYVIHRRDTFRGEERLLKNLYLKKNVEFLLNAQVTALNGEKTLESIQVTSRSGGVSQLNVEGVFVAIGQIPENRAFSNAVKLDEDGYILAAEDCKTSAEGIFAAGDCRTKSVRQLTTAAADGAIAGLAACRYIDSTFSMQK